jgi:TolB-like protein/Tfp pilus assembly protein PilF
MGLRTGTALGPYEILAPIGAGGMGEVYRAHDPRIGRDVAVKVLPAASEPERQRRFEQEARAAGALNHPNVLAVYDVGTHDGAPYIVSELLAGETLRGRMGGAPLPVRKALDYAVQVARGLAAAHEMGIVHRDLKPENLFVTKDGRVKILDFGLAKLGPEAPPGTHTPGLEPSAKDTATETLRGTLVGTLGYMSPEQVEGRSADARSDVFCFGSVLYEMVTGRRAFGAATVPETLTAILKGDPLETAPSAVERAPGLERVLRHCLEKSPDERFQSARDLAFALETLSDPAETVPARAPAAILGVRRRRWVVGLALGVVASLTLAGLARKDRLRSWLTRAGGAQGIESLAVLPLENPSGYPDQEYLTDGMTGALISALGRIEALRVISYTSAMQFKGVHKPLPDIARELNVDAVVEGSVLQVGQRVRITARLIRAVPERQLWTDSYDRELGDVLGLSSEVARAISHEIQITLTAEDEVRLAARRPVAPEVQEAYLRGRHFLNEHTAEGYRRGLEWLQRAIDKDPGFAPAYAGMATYYVREGDLTKAKPAAVRALQLDDTLADAHSARAEIAVHQEWDWETADRELERALELNPADDGALTLGAKLLYIKGHVDEAIEFARKALDLDPLSPLRSDILASAYATGGRCDEAIELGQRTLGLYPHRSLTLGWLGYCYMEEGSYAEAIELIQKGIRYSGGSALLTGLLGVAYAKAGRADDARRLLGELASHPEARAEVETTLGDKEAALASLKEALETRDYFVVWLKTNPRFDPLRSDPRFQDLLRRLNLPR